MYGYFAQLRGKYEKNLPLSNHNTPISILFPLPPSHTFGQFFCQTLFMPSGLEVLDSF